MRLPVCRVLLSASFGGYGDDGVADVDEFSFSLLIDNAPCGTEEIQDIVAGPDKLWVLRASGRRKGGFHTFLIYGDQRCRLK